MNNPVQRRLEYMAHTVYCRLLARCGVRNLESIQKHEI
jgi:hypothetical protein